MAITVVSGKTGSYTGGGLSNTWSDLGPGAGVSEGQIIIVAAVTEGAHALSAVPSGWTQLGATVNPSTNPGGLSVIAKRAGSGETGLVTLQFTSSVRVTPAWCVLDGVNETPMLDTAVVTGTTGFGTAKDLGITTATDGAGLLMVNGTDPSTTISMTWDSGIDPIVDANTSGHGHIDIGFRLQPSAGATSMGGDWSPGRGGAHMVIAFRPGSGGPPPATRIARRRSLLGVGR